jgi:CubicO group peptidase (beta-lactamase class C family)
VSARLAALLLAGFMAAGPHAFAAIPAAPGGYEIATEAGRVRISHGFGQADLEQAIAIGPDTMFRIASLTKPFTAVAVLALVEDGRLSLDARLGALLADVPQDWRPITVRQLLSHTSGLTGDFEPLLAHRTEDLSPRELTDLYRGRPLEHAPGAAWAYSNLNYWLLGQVIEAVSGRPYADFLRDRVLEPAGLEATREGRQQEIIPRRARGYGRGADGAWRNSPYFSQTLGYSAGGLISSPREMARWYEALGEGRILRSSTLALALAAAPLADGRPSGDGLGWRLTSIGGCPAAEHGGSSIGFVAYVVWIPSRRLFVGEFRNADGPEPAEEARATAVRLLGGRDCR